MTSSDGEIETRFVDRGDWPQAGVCLVFLIVFPLAIIAMWQAPRDIAPLHFLIPFAALFALGSPFLAQQVVTARTREMRVNVQTGESSIIAARPLQRSLEVIPAAISKALIMEVTRNDGFWYSAYLELQGSRRINFAQGSHKAAVRTELKRMAEALLPTHPALPVREIDR